MGGCAEGVAAGELVEGVLGPGTITGAGEGTGEGAGEGEGAEGEGEEAPGKRWQVILKLEPCWMAIGAATGK